MEILRENIIVNTLFFLNFMPVYIMEPTAYISYPSRLACVGQNENSIVTIGRQYDTGSGVLLHKQGMKTFSKNSYVEIWFENADIFGAYFCEETFNNNTSKIEFIATSSSTGQIYSKVITITLNLGETLIIDMQLTGGQQSNVELNWRHNGSVIETWKNNNTISIPNAQQNHSGIYECYGNDRNINHGLVMVFIRSCPKDRFGSGCRKRCKQCKNNGKCDDVTGDCICPKTFSGPLCEKLCPLVPIHPGGICQEDCTREMYDYIHITSCNGTVLCTKKPYGCSCPPGLRLNSNLQCVEGCPEGRYGADCSESCHCQNISKCNPIAGGNCSGECVYGWKGDKCDEKAGERNDLYAVIYPSDQNDDVYLDCGSSFRKDEIITISRQQNNLSDFITLENKISKIAHRKAITARIKTQVPSSVSYFCEELQEDAKTVVLLTLTLNDGRRLFNKFGFVGQNISLHADHKDSSTIEWYHNETKYINNATILNLTNIQLADSGSYEYSRGNGYFLIVKGCKSGQFGPGCWLIGAGCYNGGYMDEGGCLCPPGFIGKYCEKACGETSSHKETSLCNRAAQCIVCLPMPIGCTCHSGFTGRKCEQECPIGKYGADCTQVCHCKNSPNACNKITGHCTGGCAVGWNGDMCQIKEIKENNSSIGIFGIDRQHTCNCKNGPSSCDKLTGKCAGGCEVHHVGESCNYKVCNRGTYGFKCSKLCYCNNSNPCDRITGQCPAHCANGWLGKSCNIKEECSPVYFGQDCSKQCHCKNSSTCDYWGTCENGCDEGWEGENCQTIIRETNPQTHSSSIPIVTGSIIGCLILIMIMGTVAFVLYHRKKRKLIRSAVRANVLNQAYTVQELPSENNDCESSNAFKQNVRHKESVSSYGKIVQNLPLSKISWEDIKVLGILGRGHFGDVYKGILINQDNQMVAIKTLRASARDDEWLEFVDEMKVMEKVGDHPNIVHLIGICYYQSKIFMITEFLSNGDLNSFLRKSRINFKDHQSSQVISDLSSAHLLQFALDIARGMNHLTDIQILHRDLAARNVLIGDDGIAKISDFGLARKGTLYVKVTNTALPIRWMALESLEEQTYTTKSDVWSFGVLLWEIATLGATPYPSFQTNVLIAKIRDGYRLPRPYNCDNAMYELMRACWDVNPKNRPDFSHIMDSIADMLANDKDYLQLISEEGYRFEPIDEAMEERGQD